MITQKKKKALGGVRERQAEGVLVEGVQGSDRQQDQRKWRGQVSWIYRRKIRHNQRCE